MQNTMVWGLVGVAARETNENEGLSEKRKWEMLGEKNIFKVVFKGGGGGGIIKMHNIYPCKLHLLVTEQSKYVVSSQNKSTCFSVFFYRRHCKRRA